ncbi:Uncharacterized protein TCM_016661 [Theobroma cacao]|uniref:Uncharacterized protein n=1 Tax=Theobroma cacao TaxID=3641 RepID=A0A061G633_THECC|nr:Uncharacterized protein TCM_016661 [Theobroma cacao]
MRSVKSTIRLVPKRSVKNIGCGEHDDYMQEQDMERKLLASQFWVVRKSVSFSADGNCELNFPGAKDEEESLPSLPRALKFPHLRYVIR